MMTRTYKMNNNETFVKDSGLKIRSGVRGGLYNKVAIRGLKVRSSVRGGLIIKMGRA